MKKCLTCLLFTVIFLFALSAERRTALVIGNAAYEGMSRLRNPANDARDIGRKLSGLGFKVTTLIDATQEKMDDAIHDFGTRLAEGGVGLFYYSGHGAQYQGENYLIPVNATIRSAAQLRYKAVPAGIVLEYMDTAHNPLNMVILDACRDNPFAGAKSSSKGLTVVSNLPKGSIIVYATAPGETAEDGTGRNSPFTEAFLNHIGTAGLNVKDLFDRVGKEVSQSTRDRQRPWISHDFYGEFSFTGKSDPVIPKEDDRKPTFSVVKTYGDVEIEVKSIGTLYLNGNKQGAIPAGGTATLSDLETGSYALEMRYEDGKIESQSVMVKKDQTVQAIFSYVETAYGNVEVKAKGEGTLYLNGVRKSNIPSNGTGTLSNIETGSYTIEMRYADGKKESKRVTVQKERTVQAIFSYVPTPPAPEGFVLVEAGTFRMGSTSGWRDEKPVHSVTISKSFYMSKYEVTQKQRQEVMGNNPSHFKGDDLPVESVSWYDAVEYCNKLSRKEGLAPCYSGSGENIHCDFSANGYRLPTESEWEYAAQGGNRSRGYEYSGSSSPDGVSWYDDNSGKKTHAVGGKQPNELGLYDRSGNVYEWCWDWYGIDYYGSSPATDPSGPSRGSNRALRGGSWLKDAWRLRSAGRAGVAPSSKADSLGFRPLRIAE